MISTENILKEFKSTHGDKYDYSSVEYTGSENNVKIICKEHGMFEQTPYTHKKGSGCKKCHYENNNKSRKLTTEAFIQKANKVHNNFYDYGLTNFKKSNKKVTITCVLHGDFQQEANGHLQGKGCSICANSEKSEVFSLSYSNWQKLAEKFKNFDSFKVYIIKCWNDNEKFYKIGRTYVTVEDRFKTNNAQGMPYNYKVLRIQEFDNALYCCNKEKKLQNFNKGFKYVPKIKFNGMYECFSNLNSNSK